MYILPTKCNPPAIDNRWIVRPRLLITLNEALNKKLTLISAPAGYGKTTLVAQWLDHAAVPSAWLALDRHDGDPDRFLTYLTAAVRRVVPEFGAALEALCGAAVLTSPDLLANALLNELSTLNHPLVIVLDDFHLFVSEPVSAILTHLVSYQPENLHLIISTRVDPPLSVAAWRVRNWVVEIRASELRFFREEAQAFFAPLLEPSLSGDAMEMIFNRTEGWVAGMQLARLSLAAADDREGFARSFSGNHRMVADFLIDEVVARQTPEVREFLAVTALFERFCAPLCDALFSDRPDGPASHARIHKLEQENLFLVPLDSECLWYRYHHLFKTLLTHHLKAELPEEWKTQIFRRAGKWFAEQGAIEEALRYYLVAGDVKRAAELVELNLGDVLKQDASRRTLVRWLGLFPASAVTQHPALTVARIHIKTFRWDFHGINQLLDAAETALSDPAGTIPEPRRRKLLAEIDVYRGYHLYWSRDPHGALKHNLRALKYLSDAYPYHHFLAVAYAALAYAMTGARDKGLRLLEPAISAAYATGSRYINGFLLYQAGIHYYAGDLAQVTEISEKNLSLRSDHAVRQYWYVQTHWLMGCVAYERNQLDAAADHFQRVEQMRYRTGTKAYHDSLIGLALVALAQSDTAKAREHADAARAFAAEIQDSYSLVISDSFDIRLAMASPQTPAAASPQPPPVDAIQIFSETPSLTYAEHLILKDDPAARQAGLAYAQNAVAQLRQQHNPRQLIQFMAVHAAALHCSNRLNEALVALEEVLAMAQPLGFLRTFVDRGRPMAELLHLYRENGRAASYARRILDAFGGAVSGTPSDPARHAPPADQTAPLPADSLSRREREVLNLLDTSLANKEIAARFYISPETVKKHIYNIYLKLNAHSRMQAIAEAKKQGLLTDKQTT